MLHTVHPSSVPCLTLDRPFLLLNRAMGFPVSHGLVSTLGTEQTTIFPPPPPQIQGTVDGLPGRCFDPRRDGLGGLLVPNFCRARAVRTLEEVREYARFKLDHVWGHFSDVGGWKRFLVPVGHLGRRGSCAASRRTSPTLWFRIDSGAWQAPL